MRRKNTLTLCLVTTLLLTAIVGIGVSSSTTTTRLYVDPAPIINPDLGPGSAFSVNVTVESVTDLYGWSVRLRFNPVVVNVTSVEFTTWLKEESGNISSVYLLLIIRNDLGFAYIGQMLETGATNGADGSGTLANVTFGVKKRGVTALELYDSKLRGAANVEIDHDAEDGLFDNRAEENEPPVAIFDRPLFALAGEEVTFDASASKDPDIGGWIVSYEWDFDYDGITFDVDATGMIVKYAFPSAGNYTVALRVTDNNDAASKIATREIGILTWMEGGTFPDLVGKLAWPERSKLDEYWGIREMDLYGMVGNPTKDEYEVYVEFTLISKDEAKTLGTLVSDTFNITGGDIITLSALFDTSDPTWRCFSGSPEWAPYGYVHWLLHKYVAFASCYYKNATMSEFEKGNVAAYFGFNVAANKHDIGVTDVTLSAREVQPGGTVGINVTVTNAGNMSETFDVTVDWMYAWNITGNIGKKEVTIEPWPWGEDITVPFVWNTASNSSLGPHLILAKLPVLPYEKTVGDNTLSTVVFIVDYSLKVKTTPVTGEVFVDGESWGEAPQSRLKDPGTYTVSFGYVEGYHTPADITITVTEDQVTTVTGVYEPKALLTVNTMPVAGNFTVDGKAYGLANRTIAVEPGTYTVTFRDVWGCNSPDPITVEVQEDEEVSVTGVYAPKALLTVETEALYGAKPVEGVVFLNGTAYGLAPQTIAVEPGTYNVTFGTVPGYITPDPIIVTVTETVTVIGTVTVTEAVIEAVTEAVTIAEGYVPTGQTTTAEHDITVLSLEAPIWVGVNETVMINVTIGNQGDNKEKVDVTVYYNEISIDSQTTWLEADAKTTLSFDWDTTGVSYGNYTINATATILPSPLNLEGIDDDPTDNSKTTTTLIVEHDVAVTDVDVSSERAEAGEIVTIDITVENEGFHTEEANVAVYYNMTYIDSEIVTLVSGDETIVSFDWDTTGLVAGSYTINATATISLDDDPTDNSKTATISVGHDVAVLSVDAPIWVGLNENKTAYEATIKITVAVENQGPFREKVGVTVSCDDYTSSQTVWLAAGADTTLSFSWDTTGVTPGCYNLTATATALPSPENRGGIDDDPTDNSMTKPMMFADETIVTSYYKLVPYFHITTKRINYTGVFTPEWVGGEVFVNGLSWGTASPNQSRPIVAGGSDYVNATHITPGIYTISFGDIPGYTTPASITVEIPVGALEGRSIRVTGEYVPITGYLTVRTQDACGKVYVNDVSWGYVDPETPLTREVLVGTYSITFGRVPGMVTPGTVVAEVEEGLETIADPGVYVPET